MSNKLLVVNGEIVDCDSWWTMPIEPCRREHEGKQDYEKQSMSNKNYIVMVSTIDGSFYAIKRK